MSLKHKIRLSKFLISLAFSVGYAAYFAYALYFYLTFRTGLGIALLCLIAVALALSVVVTAVSYRVNLKGAKSRACIGLLKWRNIRFSCFARALRSRSFFPPYIPQT